VIRTKRRVLHAPLSSAAAEVHTTIAGEYRTRNRRSVMDAV